MMTGLVDREVFERFYRVIKETRIADALQIAGVDEALPLGVVTSAKVVKGTGQSYLKYNERTENADVGNATLVLHENEAAILRGFALKVGQDYVLGEKSVGRKNQVD